MTGPHLYDLGKELMVLRMRQEEALEAGMEPAERDALLEAELTAIELPFEQKAEHVLLWAQEEKRKAEAAEAEVKRLKKREEAHRHLMERLRLFVIGAMQLGGEETVDTGRIRATLCFAKKVGDDIVEALLPALFWRVKETREPNRDAILRALKGGQEVPGAVLEEKPYLRIR